MAKEIEKAEKKPVETQEPVTGEIEETKIRFTPALDIIEKKDVFEVVADVPGADADSIDISIENNILKLRVKVTPPELEGLPLLYQEYEVGDFETSLRISDRIDVGKIEAKLKDGIITLTLPKREEVKPRQIEVKAA